MVGLFAAGCQLVSGLSDLETEEPPVTTACELGQERACYDGPASTAGLGICEKGTQRCEGSPAAWGPCEGQILPAETEVCGDANDDDCDGNVECAGDLLWATALGTPGDERELPLERAGVLPTSGGLAWVDGQVFAALTFAPAADSADAVLVALSDVDGTVDATLSPGNDAGQEVGDDVTVLEGEPVFGGFAQDATLQFEGAEPIVFPGLGGFLARPAPLAESSWTRQIGGNGQANTIATIKLDACEEQGAIAVVGQYLGTPGTLPEADEFTAFAALYDAATGEPIWMQPILLLDNSGSSKATQVSCSDGRMVVGGVYKGPATQPDRPDHLDAWVIGLDLDGGDLWPAQTFGLPPDVEPTSPDDRDPLHHENRLWDLWLDEQGDIYVVGTFATELQVGDLRLSAGSEFTDLWIAKLDHLEGAPLWARSFGGSGPQMGYAIQGVDGGLLVGGAAVSALTLGDGLVLEEPAPASAPGFGFVVRLDREGACEVAAGCWASKLPQPSMVFRLEADDSGHAYAFGGFADRLEVAGQTVSAQGAGDLFVAQLAL